MDFKEIKELIKIFDKSGLNKLKIKEENFEIALQKGYETETVTTITAPQTITTSVPQTSQMPIQSQSKEEETVIEKKKGDYITSPMVGTFYKAPSPDSPPFVKVGDVVSKGQTIAIIEAMKIFNEIEAEFDCKILEVLVEDGQPVEYDMPLFLVERL